MPAIDRAATGAGPETLAGAFAPRSGALGDTEPDSDAASSVALAPDRTADPLDDTAVIPEVLSTALARRAELALLLARERDQTQQARLDRMRSAFDNAQLERSELLREMNALRDMAIEQTKKDDEVLKKFIAMI